MEFRDLRQQYLSNRDSIHRAVTEVMESGIYIGGRWVTQLEQRLAEYTNVKYCISCANGTDALQLALMAWEIGQEDAVFVPDFTFFSTAEAVSLCGATPVFVDVDAATFNMDYKALECAVEQVLEEGRLIPKAVIAVDLFGLPADYQSIKEIAQRYGMKVLEDAAQGFGGRIGEEKAGSFGEIATTSFFPAKPLGCYGDGGAIFTDNETVKDRLCSLKVHGKGMDKYDNVRIGMNSRLDTIQAAILLEKLRIFEEYELQRVNEAADWYHEILKEKVKVPEVPQGYYSSWAQYTVVLDEQTSREQVQDILGQKGIPTMIYYKKALHEQKAFEDSMLKCDCPVTEKLCKKVLSLPMHPYMDHDTVRFIADSLLRAIEEQ